MYLYTILALLITLIYYLRYILIKDKLTKDKLYYGDIFKNLNKLQDNDKILVMYSGGLDSVYLLYKLIKKIKKLKKNIRIVVHHITLIDKTLRYDAELIATYTTLEYFKKMYSNIYYFDSDYKFPIPQSTIQRDNEIVSYIMGQIISTNNSLDNTKIKGFITGTMFLDNELPECYDYINLACKYKHITPGKLYASTRFGIDEIKEHDKKYKILDEEYNKIKLFYEKNKIQYRLSDLDKIIKFYKIKKIIYYKLPNQFRDNYSSCRNPTVLEGKIQQCDKCLNCLLKKIYIEYI